MSVNNVLESEQFAVGMKFRSVRSFRSPLEVSDEVPV